MVSLSSILSYIPFHLIRAVPALIVSQGRAHPNCFSWVPGSSSISVLWVAGAIIFIPPSKTGCIMSCPLSVSQSVFPSINFLCPLHNSDTVQDIFMKVGTNIKHQQMICTEQEPKIHLHFYGIMPL